MPRSAAALTILPFALVLALAVEVGIAGSLATPSSPRAVSSAHPTITEFASAPPSPAQPSTPPPASGSNSADEMLRVHNELRVTISVPAVRGDDRVTTAAKRHAEYLARNGAIGHDETPGADGFTGATVRDRLAAQGYTDATASEVATSFGSGTDGVRSLWVLPYHRLGLMHPHAIVAGWGHAEISGRRITVGVIVYDFSAPAPDRVRAPALGQRVAGTYSGDEVPDVLPAGASRPVGYPIMIVFSSAREVDLRSARLTQLGGPDFAYHVVPQLYERDYVAIIPASPLVRGARYHIRLDLTVAGADLVEEWEFESEP